MGINRLDESNASLRLLLLLYKIGKPLMLSNLYYEMQKKYGLGRKATDTAIQTCLQLGLIEREKRKVKSPMPSIFQSLTVKGEKVAKICQEIEFLLRGI